MILAVCWIEWRKWDFRSGVLRLLLGSQQMHLTTKYKVGPFLTRRKSTEFASRCRSARRTSDCTFLQKQKRPNEVVSQSPFLPHLFTLYALQVLKTAPDTTRCFYGACVRFCSCGSARLIAGPSQKASLGGEWRQTISEWNAAPVLNVIREQAKTKVWSKRPLLSLPFGTISIQKYLYIVKTKTTENGGERDGKIKTQ